jgi:hypothetical protein
MGDYLNNMGGDSFACMPSFACRGRVRLLTCLLCMLGAVIIFAHGWYITAGHLWHSLSLAWPHTHGVPK